MSAPLLARPLSRSISLPVVQRCGTAPGVARPRLDQTAAPLSAAPPSGGCTKGGSAWGPPASFRISGRVEEQTEIARLFGSFFPDEVALALDSAVAPAEVERSGCGFGTGAPPNWPLRRRPRKSGTRSGLHPGKVGCVDRSEAVVGQRPPCRRCDQCEACGAPLGSSFAVEPLTSMEVGVQADMSMPTPRSRTEVAVQAGFGGSWTYMGVATASADATVQAEALCESVEVSVQTSLPAQHARASQCDAPIVCDSSSQAVADSGEVATQAGSSDSRSDMGIQADLELPRCSGGQYRRDKRVTTVRCQTDPPWVSTQATQTTSSSTSIPERGVGISRAQETWSMVAKRSMPGVQIAQESSMSQHANPFQDPVTSKIQAAAMTAAWGLQAARAARAWERNSAPNSWDSEGGFSSSLSRSQGASIAASTASPGEAALAAQISRATGSRGASTSAASTASPGEAALAAQISRACGSLGSLVNMAGRASSPVPWPNRPWRQVTARSPNTLEDPSSVITSSGAYPEGEAELSAGNPALRGLKSSTRRNSE